MKKLIMPLLALIVCWGITGDLMAASKRDLQRKRHLDDKKNEVKWYNNLNTALTEAQKSNKQILLLITGSDWCPVCKNLHSKVFEHKDFKEFANKKLVLLKADFPRRREQNAMEKGQAQEVVKKYPSSGYPTVYLLDSQGNVLEKKVGFGGGSAKSYLKSFKKLK